MAKLPFRDKAIFGLGGMGINLCDMVWLQWLGVRYAADETTALVPGKVLGAIVLAARVGECFYNLIVGHWSDNCRSPLGRRTPFIRYGTIPLAIIFFLMFMPPDGMPRWFNGAYILLMANAYLFLYAVVVTPYLSLLPEMTSDLNQRVALTISQSIFILFAQVIFAVMGSIKAAGGWVTVAILVACVTVAALMPSGLFLRSKPQPASEDHKGFGFFKSMWQTMKSPAFIPIAISTSFYWFGLNMIIMMLPFWVMNILGREESTVTMVMVPFLIMNIVAFFAFDALIKKFGKFVMFLATMLGSAVCFLLFCTIGYLPFGSLLAQTIVITGLAGIPVAGFMVIPFALLADAVDYDEQLTGQRREAMFFSVQGVAQKIMLGLSAATFFTLKNMGGGPVATRLGLNLVVVAAATASVIAFLSFLSYPLREREGKVTHKNA